MGMDTGSPAAVCCKTWPQSRTWHAPYASGNRSGRVHQTIMVVDDQPPTIGGQGNDGTVECPATASFTSPTGTDTCGTCSIVLDSDSPTPGCRGSHTRPRTWHAVDACGNTSGRVH